MKNYPSSCFIQTADIDASSGLAPIYNGTWFSGTYDGQGHFISGFTFNNSSSDHQALFPYLDTQGTIKNLALIWVNIYAYYNTGGLVSYNRGAIINCYTTGNVHGGNSRVGGLVGENASSGTITNCYSAATVWTNAVGHNSIGGLVGENYGAISRCFASGSVTGGNPGSSGVGGFVGQNNSSGTISDCYATGTVWGNSNTGGFVGNNYGTIANCYSCGHVGSNSSPGGFCNTQAGSINASYWDTQSSGRSTSSGGTGKITAEMTAQSTFTSAGWDFTITPIWAASNEINNGYPYLVGVTPPPPVSITVQAASNIRTRDARLNGMVNSRLNSTVVRFLYGTSSGVYTDSITAAESPLNGNTLTPVSATITGLNGGTTYYYTIATQSVVGYYRGSGMSFITTNAFSGGAGSSGDPYQIETIADFQAIGNSPYITGNYYFIQTADIDANATSGWNSGAGFLPIAATFNGCYDGQNHSISNLYMSRTSGYNQAIFISLSSGKYIRNLNLVNIYIRGNMYAAALVSSNNGAISNCSAAGTVIARNSGQTNTGGLVGTNSGTGTIDRCYAAVAVNSESSSGSSFGGLVGINEGLITNSYATGNTGDNTAFSVGGFVYSNSGTITNCYSTGHVYASFNFGGFAYYNSGTVNNCFWDKETSGRTTSGAGTGKTTAEMKAPGTFSDAGWDVAIWNMGDGMNNGYPYLQWQNPSGGTPLPVELFSFCAAKTEERVKVSWKTATEMNNYGFDLERGAFSDLTGAAEWKKIGFIQGHGNSNSQQEYTFTDNNPPAGKVQYRLKQLDNEGKFKYYDAVTVLVDAPKNYNLLQNSPNPFNPSTSIKFQLPENTFVTIKIFDLFGREIKTLLNEERFAGSHVVYWNGRDNRGEMVSSGVYLYLLKAGEYAAAKKMNLLK